jgi:hypothetical protein
MEIETDNPAHRRIVAQTIPRAVVSREAANADCCCILRAEMVAAMERLRSKIIDLCCRASTTPAYDKICQAIA